MTTSAAARKLAAARANPGRKPIPTRCPKCGSLCRGARLARVHCRIPRR